MTPTQFFKCLSDETRLRCITLLQREGRLCVCELTAALDLSQPKISRHLAFLRQCGMLVDSRDGQWVFYRISPDLPDWAQTVLQAALAAASGDGQLHADMQRLKKMGNRPDVAVCC